MIRAWRLADGRYRLDFGNSDFVVLTYPSHGGDLTYKGGEWDGEHKMWVVPAGLLGEECLKGAEKVFGVVAGPSSCGCEPAGFRWVTGSEAEAGKTSLKPCVPCGLRKFHSPGGTIPYVPHSFDIIDVCGEADVAEAVYDAEFSGKVEAMR